MFDKNEELITVVDPEYLLESEQTQELNGLITTVVSAPYSKELESAFYIGSRDIDDNNIFWLYKVDKRTKENNNIILNGTYSLFDDLKAYDVIRDKRPSNASALVGINAILEGSRWQVGNITSTHAGTANWYYVSRLEAFWEYLENWNVEFKPRMTFSKGKITGRYIDIVDKLSDDYGKWYEYGDKLLQVTAEQASDSLYTAFIGRGKGEESGNGYGRRIGFEKVVWTTASGKPVDKPLNQDYVEIPSATELYGYSDGKPRMTVVIFEDTEDAGQVLQQTYDYALNECRPKLQLKADVLEDGVSELGETCTIIRDDRGIRYKTRVFKITRNFLNKNQKTVEFGDEIVQSTAQRNNNIIKIIKDQDKNNAYWYEQLQKQLMDSYFNEDGYNYDLKADNEYDLPGGFYSFNAPIDQNPTKVIYMGAGTMAIANSKTPDGQWLFRTWGTGDGFTADLITAGNFLGLTFTNPYTTPEMVGSTVLKTDLTSNYTKPNGEYGTMAFSKDRVFSNLYSPDGSLIRGHNLSAEALNFNSSFGNATYNFDNIGVTRADGASSAITWAYGTYPMQIYSTQHTQLGISINGVRSSRIEYGGSGDNAFVSIFGQLNMNGNQINVADLVWDDSSSMKRGVNSLDVRAKSIYSVSLSGFAGMYLSRNTETGKNALDLYATLNMQGNIVTNTSDERLKWNIVDYPQKAIDIFRRIKPRNFKWRDTDRFGSQTETGFIAQELKEIDPTLVTQTADDKSEDGISWAINETDFNRKSWIALHETVLEIDRLKEENATIKQELEDIKKHLGLS